MLFGFAILFGSSFPIIFVFIIILNMLNIRQNAYNLVYHCKRTHLEKENGIGIWKNILDVLIYAGIITNCLLIAFTYGILDNINLF